MKQHEINNHKSELVCGDLTICLLSKVVKIGENSIIFTPLEFNLISYLAQNQGRPISPVELLESVWNCQEAGTTDQVRSCIKRIREKLRSIQGVENEIKQYIHTARGWGYRMCKSEEFPW